MSFKGKIVLVTGGSSGIGLKTIIEFIERSAEIVYTCGRTTEKWEIAKVILFKKLGDKSNKIKFIQSDIRIENEVKNLIKQIFKENHQLDICVNNAGVNIPPINIWEQDFGKTTKNGDIIKYEFLSVDGYNNKQTPIFTNLYGTIFCLKWELKYILKYNDPSKPVNIVNVSSSFQNYGNIQWATYTASKAGVDSLTKSISKQVANYRIKNKEKKVPLVLINGIEPGSACTPLFLNNLPKNTSLENIIKDIPLGRIAKPEEIAHAIIMLSLYKNTTYMTGSSILFDGGANEISDNIV